MPDLFFGNSEKLTITAFKNGKRTLSSGKIGSFEAMFNPETVRRRFENRFRGQQSLNSAGRQAYFAYTRPERIEFTILIDGTSLGASLSANPITLLVPPPEVDVRKKVESFRSLAFTINGEIHQPNFLKLSMGTALEDVSCRLASYTLEFSNFDGKGNPMRAEIQATFITETDTFKQNALIAKQSADLTHRRTIKNGDTLPAMTEKIYGSPDHYIQVARFNDLDHFRQIKPGTVLFFPPLDDKETT